MPTVKNAVLKRLESQRAAAWCAPMRMARNLLGWKRARPALRDCRRILVIRPDEIGDVVLTSPFFRSLRRCALNAHITLVTNETCRPLLENCPYIDEVYSLPFKQGMEARHRAELVLASLRLRLSFLWRGFDVVLLPRMDADWVSAELAAHLLAGHGTIATNSAAFITWTIDPTGKLGLADICHEIPGVQSDALSNLEFLQLCGGSLKGENELAFWTNPKDKKFAEKWLASGSRQRPKLVLHPPSGTWTLKRWPVGRSRELIDKLVRETEFEIIVVGGEQDGWVLEELRGVESDRVRLAFNTFSLLQLGEVIRECGCFVGGDSGPMHIAAAVGAKVIGIFGYASEVRFRPWSEKAQVLSLRYHCSPDRRGTFEANCMKCIYPENRCLTELSADQVLDKVKAYFFPENLVPATLQ